MTTDQLLAQMRLKLTKRGSKKALADYLECSPVLVSYWLSGKRKLSRHTLGIVTWLQESGDIDTPKP